MGNNKPIEEQNDLLERIELSSNRIKEIVTENTVKEPFNKYFKEVGEFLRLCIEVLENKKALSLDEKKEINKALYKNIIEKNYEGSYANPKFAVKELGEYGKALSAIYSEIRVIIPKIYEKNYFGIAIYLELFIQLYTMFNDDQIPKSSSVVQLYRDFNVDYCGSFVEESIESAILPNKGIATNIILNSDLYKEDYLYDFGEYISENQIGIQKFLAKLPKDEIIAMAKTYTEGFRRGFILGRKDLSKKKTVNIRYTLGFELMVKEAIFQFKEMGLEPIIYRYSSESAFRNGINRNGYTGASANLQYDYDHSQDKALYISPEYLANRLRFTQVIYEKNKEMAGVFAGPAVIEAFGENPFSPEGKKENLILTKEQKDQLNKFTSDYVQILNRYIKGEERSFCIIAYPLPEIGNDFEEIFKGVVELNNLDNDLYSKIHQSIIDALDSCEWVEIKGNNGNETDLIVHLHTLKNKDKETNFENCLADVNIPVGEVFTSPVLAGTSGVLHVKEVYLNGLLFKNLKLTFDCGQIIEFSCTNFDNEEDNKKYIDDNILHNHSKLPMGEFAIGTNTTAYVLARKFKIENKLPILIAEKMGPHFAVGDTCYSHSEDVKVYNPDGKEIIARDNEISILRKENPSDAYYGCHTDITIPYDELGSIRVIDDEGDFTSIIENGRFVLKGTEELNKPFNQ